MQQRRTDAPRVWPSSPCRRDPLRRHTFPVLVAPTLRRCPSSRGKLTRILVLVSRPARCPSDDDYTDARGLAVTTEALGLRPAAVSNSQTASNVSNGL